MLHDFPEADCQYKHGKDCMRTNIYLFILVTIYPAESLSGKVQHIFVRRIASFRGNYRLILLN